MKVRVYKSLKQYAVVSSITAEQFAKVKKYKPAALRIKDEEGNDLFAIAYSEGRPCIAKCGVTFGSTDENGNLQIVGVITPAEGQSDKDFVADIVAPVYEYLAEIEKQILEAVTDIQTAHTELVASISEI